MDVCTNIQTSAIHLFIVPWQRWGIVTIGLSWLLVFSNVALSQDTQPKGQPQQVANGRLVEIDPPPIQRVSQDLTVQNQPVITRAEAYAGRPLGIGRVSFRMREGDEMVIRTGSAMLRERSKRVLYPVMTKSAVVKF